MKRLQLDSVVLVAAAVVLTLSSTLPSPGLAQATYYVRADGGSASQCSGTVDAPYPGSGVNIGCAWNHPFWALPPGGVQSARIAGGDTLVVGPGSYRMGFGAPNSGDCDADGAYICTMAPVPSGPSAAQPTRILGAGWNTGCGSPPEMWGTERAYHIVDLIDADNVVLACLELTDHSSCIQFHTGSLTCERDTAPYGQWAETGIAAADSENVVLRDLHIHGLSDQGVLAGRLKDWLLEDVRIDHNGWAGWNGDISGSDMNTGKLEFRRVTIAWNGCGETYPGGATVGCWSQTAGGYGDGLGTGATTGHWIFEDSDFLYNTSDGLDLLYLQAPSQVEITRMRAEGNAGNQVKVVGDTSITNSVVVGNCGYFDGQPFTFNVDNCRAAGNALDLVFRAGTQSTLVNSTVFSEGDCILLVSPDGCNGSESLLSRNNVFIGGTDFFQPWEQSCFVYNDGCPVNPLNQDYGVIFGAKNAGCPVGGHDICGDPKVVGSQPDTFDGRLLPGSPALDSGATSPCMPYDWRGVACPQDGDANGSLLCDRGAFEAQRAANLQLVGETIARRRTWESCDSISASSFSIFDPANVVFEAGNQIVLGDGFLVGPGGKFLARLRKPSACP